jgi:PAS domain S-box-containing protein
MSAATLNGSPPALRTDVSRNGGVPGNDAVNILLVDDRDDKLLALEAVLGTLNQNLVKVRSGKEALRQVLHQEFAVILLDVSMPTMDGFETAALMRQRLATEHTPIIFITSHNATDNYISRGYSLGAVDYILTPLVPEVLRAKVSVFVELYRKTEKIRQQSERLRQIEEAEHQRKLAEAKDMLERETKRNRFFTLALDMLAVGSYDGRFLEMNPAFEKVLGYTIENLNTFSWEMVHPDDRAALIEMRLRIVNGSCIDYAEGRFRRKDGDYRWLGFAAVPFPEQKLIYIFARDITARKESEEKIRTLNHELEKRVSELTDINKELESFNYSISHDLRAPLRAMQGFASTLLHEYGTVLDEEGKDFAQRIVRSSMYMDTLLHDLLDYSRLSRSQLEPSTVNISVVVNEILTQLEKEIDDKKAEVQIELPLFPISAHMPTLRQILFNLITNALKFTVPGKTPLVRVWTERRDSNVRIWVSDNGIGIAPEHQERIFGLFERLHSNQAYSGTGIGLAIVRKGAERMGGKVGIESSPEKGSRFWVELPAASEEVPTDTSVAA